MKLKALLPKIEQHLDYLARMDWQRFVDEDGDLDLDCNTLLYEALDQIFQDDDDKDLDAIVEALEPMAAVELMFEDMKLTIRESAQDAREWRDAQSQGLAGILAYHGMSIKDFI